MPPLEKAPRNFHGIALGAAGGDEPFYQDRNF